MTKRRKVLLALLLVGLAVALGGGRAIAASLGLDPHYDYQNKQGAVSNEVAQLAMTAVPYPLAQVSAQAASSSSATSASGSCASTTRTSSGTST